MPSQSEYIVVLTNLPSQDNARFIAQRLLEEKLCACVNILSPCVSMYHWQDKIETDNEIPMFIKTKSAHFDEIQGIIKKFHPYDVPEIIALPIMDGDPEYLNWIDTVSPSSK